MRILVTGGAGFIGSNFIRLMMDRHPACEILNLDLLTYAGNLDNLKGIDKDPKYTFVRGDICDRDLVRATLENFEPEAIVHFAAESHVDRSIADPSVFVRTNVLGTHNLLENARRHDTPRFIHISTDEVYGDILDGSFSEESTLRPSSPYSASKAAGDVYVLAYARTYGLHAMITRCTNNYGPYQFPEKLIPKTILRAKANLKIPIYGTGQNVRDWIYVMDHCRAVEQVLMKGSPGRIYNVSASEEKTNLQVATVILEMLGKDDRQIEFVEDRPGHDVRYSLDSSRIRDDLGWRPKESFAGGIQKTVDWYLQNEEWWRPLLDEKVLAPAPWKLKW